ncbi:MAG TPA: hypothetical protein VNI60_08665 [Pyrinomonadaceae bacterium]|nr:hypothetical protein [Pyrinomonadaceae bacterium]
MNQTSYEQIIVAGVKHLSPERQREVADFVYFLREREKNGVEYAQLIEADLAELEGKELKHLEEEFKDYDKTFPRR